MLKLDRIIELTRLNPELALPTINDFGEQELGSPNTTARVWSRREILSGGQFFRSDGFDTGQNVIFAAFVIRHRVDVVPMKSGIIDSDRRLWLITSFTELRERGRNRWLRLECQHSSESYQDATARFVGRVAPPAAVSGSFISPPGRFTGAVDIQDVPDPAAVSGSFASPPGILSAAIDAEDIQPPVLRFLLLENGDKLLLENGGKMLLEDSA